MSKKMMNIVIVLTCALMMLTGAISANAEGHDCMEIVDTKTPQNSYRYKDSNEHYHKYVVKYKCQICNNAMGNIEIEEVESHVRGTYQNLGHNGGLHNYQLICGTCNGNAQRVTIPCEFDETGRHNTPW